MAKEKIAFKEMISLEKLLSVLMASTDFIFETLHTVCLRRQGQGRKRDLREEAVLLKHSQDEYHIQEQRSGLLNSSTELCLLDHPLLGKQLIFVAL